MVIESTRNETVKRARALAQRKGRLEQGVHFIEGEKLVREAVVSGAQFVDAFIEDGHDLMAAVLSGSGANVYTVRRSVMESLTQTGTPQWVCATVKTPEQPIPEYYPAGLIVALDCVQDPGNLGTILRTADAMGACGLLLGEGCATHMPLSRFALRWGRSTTSRSGRETLKTKSHALPRRASRLYAGISRARTCCRNRVKSACL